ncbi:ComEC/Rec2 family competence protein [Falsiroseomonas tokyonensis]|uniref:ComEC/Rec2 family competence protein n=1 Tax=Falsiroseomonas tokyonensis TaxID=430521 RepID=A0ABV7BSX3_9PROT|nr:ComEC/Rec2 family competence protein [Falsiroseomonas tokyonensis]MBU8538132.1 ComEC/Rec2 family competence protein [Falsiroseomonas tokyonensis]
MSIALHPVERQGAVARIGDWLLEMLARQQGRFAPWLAVALGAGVLWYFDQPVEPRAQPLWLALPLLGLAAFLARRWWLVGWAAALPGAVLLGAGLAAWHAGRQPAPLHLPFNAVVLEGVVAQVEPLPEGRRMTLREVRLGQGPPLDRHIRVRLRAEDPIQPQPGDRLRLRALLREPGAPVVPGGYDFQRAAFFSGLGGSGFALDVAERLEGGGEGAWFAALRARLEREVTAAIPGAAGAVAAALITGTQSGIPAPAMVAMRDSGLAHLLSVSGLHMAIVMGLVFFLLRLALALLPWLALRVPGKAVAALGSLAAGAFYMLLTGSQVPMQRCLGMAALVTLALLTGRRALSPRVIAIAAAGVLAVAPAELLGPSFQMSFAAVLALIAGHEATRAWLARLRAAGGWWRPALIFGIGLVLTSLLAGTATAPYGLHHFGRLQLFGILSNPVAVPLTSVLVMPAALLAMLALPFGLAEWPLWAMGWGVEGILLVARTVAAWPGAAPALPPLPGWGLALATLGFCWLGLWRGGLRAWGLPLILAGLASPLASPPPDLLVSADARIVALRTAEGVYLHRLPGARVFVRDNMLRAMGATEARPLPETGTLASGALACTPAACRFRPRPDAAEAVLLRGPPPARGQRSAPLDASPYCDGAALVVALEPLRPRCATGESIDRFAMWRDGAQAAWLGQAAARRLSDRAWRGDRPWVPPEPLPGRVETLPLAPVDDPSR